MWLKKVLSAILTVLLFGIICFPTEAEGSLYIDTTGIYPGMERSYQDGYIPAVEKGKVHIVLPLRGGLGSELIAVPNFGNTSSCPFVFANYNMIVVRDGNGLFLIDYMIEILDNSATGTYPIIFNVSTSEGTTGTFTVYVTLKGNRNFWAWIEDHSTFLGISSKIVFWMAGLIIAGAFFYFNSYSKKKAAALFGFYTSYEILLSILQEQLKKCNEKTNPYTLLYKDDARAKYSLLFPGASPSATVAMFEAVSMQLKELLLKSDSIVYPKHKSKREWYNSTLTVVKFSLMITEKIENNTIDIKTEDADKIYKQKWEALNKAIKDLLKDIKGVQY